MRIMFALSVAQQIRLPGSVDRKRGDAPVLKKVVCGFAGVGKTWFVKNATNRLVVVEYNARHFGWVDYTEKVRHPEWPNNYISHVLATRNKFDYMLISTHREVREALVRAGIPFVLVYPSLEMMDEIIGRYVARGSRPSLIELVNQNYKTWFNEMVAQQNCENIMLKQGQYLVDVLEKQKKGDR